MFQKIYCIVKKGNDFYFPIKAKLGPYKERGSNELKVGYLAGAPNFFGGTVEGQTDPFLTLAEEIMQETQCNIAFPEGADGKRKVQTDKVHEACVDTFVQELIDDGRQTYYSFFLFDADMYESNTGDPIAITDFGEENRLVLKTEADDRTLEAKYREMSCILKIAAGSLPRDMGNFLDMCETAGGGFVYDRETIMDCSDWKDRGTRDAFEEFLAKYGH